MTMPIHGVPSWPFSRAGVANHRTASGSLAAPDELSGAPGTALSEAPERAVELGARAAARGAIVTRPRRVALRSVSSTDACSPSKRLVGTIEKDVNHRQPGGPRAPSTPSPSALPEQPDALRAADV